MEEAGLQGLSLSMDLLRTPPMDQRRERGHSLATQLSLSILLFLELIMRLMELSKAFRCLRQFRERMSEATSSVN